MRTILPILMAAIECVAAEGPILVPAPQACQIGAGAFVVLDSKPLDAHVAFFRDASVPPEGYRLSVMTNGIRVVSSDSAGAFYARETLKQLRTERDGTARYPIVEIRDAPRYGWRGVHIDDCRHFFGKQTVKRVLDLMAMHKMNVLHWHLTDDQGWRLDVPGYPELIKFGAVRSASPVHGALWQKRTDGKKFLKLDGQTYGPFFYRESDIREIVGYASERHITIVPEIELPGHVASALAAYPELACRPENLSDREPRLVWGVEKDVLCLGNDRAIRFMEDVLDYVCCIFPGQFVHIGGDECPVERWRECPKCLSRVRNENLADVNGLQPWVTRHFMDFLEKRGKRAVGWDECLNGNVPTNAVGMNWRTMTAAGVGHDGVKLMSGAEAVEKGYEMVVTPHDHTYFYYDQGLAEDPFQYGATHKEYGSIGLLPISKVYAFNPCAGVEPSVRHRILGSECCNWSEYTWNRYDLEWKMWPRTCAMAEVLWTGDARPGFSDFRRRMEVHRKRLISIGVHCAPLGD